MKKTKIFIFPLFFVLIVFSMFSVVFASYYDTEGFETGWGEWNSGGGVARLEYAYSHTGSFSVWCGSGGGTMDGGYIVSNGFDLTETSNYVEFSFWMKVVTVETYSWIKPIYLVKNGSDILIDWTNITSDSSDEWFYNSISLPSSVFEYSDITIWISAIVDHSPEYYGLFRIDDINVSFDTEGGAGSGTAWIASDAGVNWLSIAITILMPSFIAVGLTKNWVPPHIVFLSMVCLMSCIDYAVMPSIMPLWLVFVAFFVTAVIFIGTLRRGT